MPKCKLRLHTLTLGKFGSLLGDMAMCPSTDMEMQSIDADVIAWVQLLKRQRFQFPNNWLHVDNIEREWSAFNEIINRMDTPIPTQVTSLQAKVEDVATRTVDFLENWEKTKATAGKVRPEDAL